MQRTQESFSSGSATTVSLLQKWLAITVPVSHVHSLGPNQQFTYDPSTEQIKVLATRKCLDYDFRNNDVQIYPCRSQPANKLITHLVAMISLSLCVSFALGHDGQNQKWYVTTSGELKTKHDGKCLDRWSDDQVVMHGCHALGRFEARDEL